MDSVTEKTCNVCGVVKSLECFWRHPTSKFGRDAACKECRQETRRRWARTPEGREATRRKWQRQERRRRGEIITSPAPEVCTFSGLSFRVKDIEWFNRNHSKDSVTGCWVWHGSKDKYGYGRQALGRNRCILAHRVSWMMHRSAIPRGMHVLHSCDNPGCVNPEHLFLGDHAANMNDMKQKGRARGPRGERHRLARLTERDVLWIRGAKGRLSQSTLSRMYGVTQSCISGIQNYKIWAWLEPRANEGPE